MSGIVDLSSLITVIGGHGKKYYRNNCKLCSKKFVKINFSFDPVIKRKTNKLYGLSIILFEINSKIL